MSRRKTVETFTMTLIGTDGRHIPIGFDGAPVFHAFHYEAVAREAIVAAVSRFTRANTKAGTHTPVPPPGEIGDLQLIEAVTVTTTQVSAAGKLLVFTMHKLSRDELREMCAGATVPRLLNQITDRRVNA